VLRWYCVIRHPTGLTPELSDQERRHWIGLSRVLIERGGRDQQTLIEVRAYRSLRRAECDAIAGSSSARRRPTETASLVQVNAWFPFRACLRSLKPKLRRPLRPAA
jgi:hypothetical protein